MPLATPCPQQVLILPASPDEPLGIKPGAGEPRAPARPRELMCSCYFPFTNGPRRGSSAVLLTSPTHWPPAACLHPCSTPRPNVSSVVHQNPWALGKARNQGSQLYSPSEEQRRKGDRDPASQARSDRGHDLLEEAGTANMSFNSVPRAKGGTSGTPGTVSPFCWGGCTAIMIQKKVATPQEVRRKHCQSGKCHEVLAVSCTRSELAGGDSVAGALGHQAVHIPKTWSSRE